MRVKLKIKFKKYCLSKFENIIIWLKYKMNKNMYINSTQKRNWIFTQQNIESITIDKIKRIINRINTLQDKKYIKSIQIELI